MTSSDELTHRAWTGTRAAVLVLFTGLLAAVCLGKFTPYIDAIRTDFRLSLAGVAALTSLLTLVAAVAAVPLGVWAARHAADRLLVGCLLLLGVAGLAESMAGTAWLLFALRLVEGLGFLGVVILGPALITALVRGGARNALLALWGAAIPAGLSVAAALGGLTARYGWRWWLGGVAVTALVLALACHYLLSAGDPVPGDPVPAGSPVPAGATLDAVPLDRAPVGTALSSRPVWLLAIGFALMANVGVAILAVLPAYLADERGLTATAAGLATSVAAAGSLVGSAVSSAFLHRGVAAGRLLPAAAVIPAAAAGTFLIGGPALPSVGSAALLMVVNGVAVSGVFAALPAVAGGAAQVAAANGVLTQLGSVAGLLSPPALALAVEQVGWGVSVPVIAAVVAVGTLSAIASLRRSRPTAS